MDQFFMHIFKGKGCTVRRDEEIPKTLHQNPSTAQHSAAWVSEVRARKEGIVKETKAVDNFSTEGTPNHFKYCLPPW